MDQASKVATPAALATRVESAIAAWGCALVEEFVGGREATVLVVQDTGQQPVALTPVECVFSGARHAGEAFKDFDTKFGAGAIAWRAMDAPQDAGVADALREASVKVQSSAVPMTQPQSS